MENNNYQELFKEIGGEENFESRFQQLLKTIKAFLVEGEYDDGIQCNERILYHVLLDYYSDIIRLKDFHEILYTKTDKNIAYLIFWFVRRKPIQMNCVSDNEKDIFVNERFACYLLINECIFRDEEGLYNYNLNDEGLKVFDKYMDLLLYYLKYRQLNPQMIELWIESFKLGRYFPINKVV